MLRERFRPAVEAWKSIAHDVLGPGNNQQIARLSAFFIIGVLSYLQENHALITQMYPDERFDPRAVERLTELLTRFLLAGMESLKKPLK